MMRNILCVFVFLAVLIVSCKNKSDAVIEIAPKEQIAANQAGASKTNTLPSLTKELMQKIAKSCDYIDYIFYNLPISISQDEKSAIMSNINFISRETLGDYSSSCKSMGRKSFQSDGEIILEADIYLDKANGCFFYIFLEDGKPAYANKISKDGINFYFNVFGQAGLNK